MSTSSKNNKSTNKKPTNVFSNELKSYDDLRRLLRIIYLYGNASTNDILDSKVLDCKKTALDQYIRRVKNNLDGEELDPAHHYTSFKNPSLSSSEKLHSVIIDPFKNNYNFLASTFMQHVVGTNDLLAYMYLIMAIVPDKLSKTCPYIDIEGDFEKFFPPYTLGKFFNIDDLLFSIEIYYQQNSMEVTGITEDFLLTKKILNERLENLTKIGVLTSVPGASKRKGDSKMYRFVDDPISKEFWGNNYSKALLQFFNLTGLFYNYLRFSVPGYFLYENLFNRLELSNLSDTTFHIAATKPIFVVTNTSFQNTIDNDVIWEMLKAIHEKRILEFTFQNGTLDKAKTLWMLPIKIIEDNEYGREYVLGLKYKQRTYKKVTSLVPDECDCIRIDKIYEVKSELGDLADTSEISPHPISANELENMYKSWSENVWNVDSKSNDTKKVCLLFHFNNTPHDQRLYDYLLYSKRNGIIEPINENGGDYRFTVMVKSPDEMIPWINGFGTNVKVEPSTDPDFYVRFKNQCEEMLNLYGSF